MSNDTMKLRFAALAEAHNGKSITELGQRFVAVDAELDEISAAKAQLEAEKEFLRVKLAEKMVEENMPRFSIGDKRIRHQEELFVSAPEAVAPQVISVLKDSGNGSMVKETVHPSTLKAFVKNLRAASADGLPDPVLAQLIEAGMTTRVIDMARFY